MNMIQPEQAVKDLTLILMYLTRFVESDRNDISFNQELSWKGYDFDTINELADEELIWQRSKRSKSVAITVQGLQIAQALLARYNIADWK